jgi:hypothetical protein
VTMATLFGESMDQFLLSETGCLARVNPRACLYAERGVRLNASARS